MEDRNVKKWKENLSKEDIAEFLISLGNQLKEGDTLTVRTDTWEVPFTFKTPIELSVEHNEIDKELEIELEFKEKQNKGSIQIK